MYYLTLTHEDRKAIDWIGYRYFHGDYLRKLLWCESKIVNPVMDEAGIIEFDGGHKEELEWSTHCSITFEIPEHVAWQIRDGAEQEEYQWTCFAEELKEKMQQFVGSII